MDSAPAPKLSDRLKISLDELRMQVLGAQVLFGFQFQSLFQEGFEQAGARERGADALALAATLIAFAMLIAAPAQHRLVHAGAATRQLIDFSNRCAQLALAAQAFAFGCIGFTIAAHLDVPMPMLAGLSTLALAALGWFGLGAWV